jgi:hypothetical protein
MESGHANPCEILLRLPRRSARCTSSSASGARRRSPAAGGASIFSAPPPPPVYLIRDSLYKTNPQGGRRARPTSPRPWRLLCSKRSPTGSGSARRRGATSCSSGASRPAPPSCARWLCGAAVPPCPRHPRPHPPPWPFCPAVCSSLSRPGRSLSVVGPLVCPLSLSRPYRPFTFDQAVNFRW